MGKKTKIDWFDSTWNTVSGCMHGQAMRGGIRKALREIETSPTVDAVEVVRCRDCKHTTRSKVSPEKIICCLTKMCGTVDPDYFCADGEREIDAEAE